jgi:amidase
MNDAALHYLSLDDVARRLRARTVSSLEVTKAILDRIDRVDRQLHSYATLTADRALADAARRDAEAAAGVRA